MVLTAVEKNLQANGRAKSLEKVEEAASTGQISGDTAETATPYSAGDKVILPDKVLDELYHSYSIKQRRAGLIWFLAASVLFDIWSLVVPLDQTIECRLMTGVIFLINISFCVKLRLHKKILQVVPDKWKQPCNDALEVSPNSAWLVTICHLFCYLMLQKSFSQRDVLGWVVLLHFLIYVTLPNPLIFTGIVVGVLTFCSYMLVEIDKSTRDPMFSQQFAVTVLLLLTAIAIGLLNYFLGEAKQKRAFLEAKKSIEVKMTIEEQSAEQERLLLSVLPEHVAVKMRQDLGSISSEPFKKIYMSRHENVSILYADIVGFTAISSTYSAQDLVKMLNELFARFDRLAEKYQQLRIKILGDCYYCISGAPIEKPDHAVLCVHMGLSMVKAIKYVQQKTKSPVDMRVGIHTGAVLAGILGQRQWQFDVYSRDVELANKMESSGKAGRVHISNKTLSFLNGEFEVEPALGERREEAFRIAGLKTYYIMKVLVPFASQATQENNGTVIKKTSAEDADEEFPEDRSNGANGGQQECATMNELYKQEVFKKRLQHELVARDGHGELSKDTTIFLSFKNMDLEMAYKRHREPYSSLPLLAALLVQLIACIYYHLILLRSTKYFLIAFGLFLGMMVDVCFAIAESFPRVFPKTCVQLSKQINDQYFLRIFCAVFIIFVVGGWHFTSMSLFGVTFQDAVTPPDNYTNNLTLIQLENIIRPFNDNGDDISAYVRYPSFMSHFGVLTLIAISVVAQLTHIIKILAMLLLAGLYCYCNIFLMTGAYMMEEHLLGYPIIPVRFSASGIIVVAAIALSFLARHMDREDRVIFKWKTEVAWQKEMATDMRRRNEALVYNVLPVHVAEHFMKNSKRSHDDLYSQSYSEVGVLFASMPNFSDFYSEETVNNQGLECLRFLNEVISDFDALLELPQFQDIIKIKTIGSTYMVASGINLTRKTQPDDPITKRWAHLDLLVEFALELKTALHGINEQSFNHFVLKMGVNHGPITAGVIGARKPHYDIWGNTVNVASRMESTGKAGAIQVTEETCNILQAFGYTFEQRGLVSVKGKGQLMTYYLKGKTVMPTKKSQQRNGSVSDNINEQTESNTASQIVPDVSPHKAKNHFNLTINNLDEIPDSQNSIPLESDPRSPRLLVQQQMDPSPSASEKKAKNNISHMNSIDRKTSPSGSGHITEETAYDLKTPLLKRNLNSTNLDSIEFNHNEKDSLICK